MNPTWTYTALLVVQALHLIHHRLTKRHISFVEGITGVVLCVPPTVDLPPWLLMVPHLGLIAIQIVGSIWIRKLSPDWANSGPSRQ